MLFKEFGDVDAFPICLATKDVDEIVAAVKAIAPGFGGINLEDISAPRCFEVERRLREELDIPVFHDDQHGTAIVVLAALINALRVVDKRLEDVRIVTTGCGAAGTAVTKILLARRRAHDHRLRRGRRALPGPPRPERREARVRRADESRQTSAAPPTRCSPAPTSSSASPCRARSRAAGDRAHGADPIVFALANPRSEIEPEEIEDLAARDRDRPLRLSEPDQQRARVPRRLPRRARRSRARDHARDGARGRARDRAVRSPTTSSPPTTSSRASSTGAWRQASRARSQPPQSPRAWPATSWRCSDDGHVHRARNRHGRRSDEPRRPDLPAHHTAAHGRAHDGARTACTRSSSSGPTTGSIRGA